VTYGGHVGGEGYGGNLQVLSLNLETGGKMPTKRSRLIKTEEQEYRTRLSWLEKMSIPIGPAGDPSPEPDRLTFEQTWDELARIYELASGAVAVVVPAKMIVLKSGILITDVAMMTPWGDLLDLDDPEESPDYKGVIGSLYHSPPTLLNPYLERDLPLDVRQVKGVIIAHGQSSIPSKYHDESPVTVELLLRDERREELSFDFGVRVDRSMKREYERRQREQIEHSRWTKRTGLFGPARRQPGDQKSVSPEKPSSGRKLAVSISQPVTQETRKPN
jgi:hypothetical protein